MLTLNLSIGEMVMFQREWIHYIELTDYWDARAPIYINIVPMLFNSWVTCMKILNVVNWLIAVAYPKV